MIMLVHIAIYKWKPGTTEAKVLQAFEEIKLLKRKVPGLHSIYCGKNFSKFSEGFTHAIVVLAENQQALDAYRKHPGHEKAAKIIEEMEESGIGIDFNSI